MLVSIHQPNFFPWLGFFDKIAHSDLFILLDNVSFTKGGYQNRVQLKGTNGAFWLTAPVITKGRMGQITNNVEINNLPLWKEKHWGSLSSSYKRAPGYDRLMPQVLELYEKAGCKLVDLTIPGILLLKDFLKIKTPFLIASNLNCKGSSSRLLCDLVKNVGGTTYLSGPSGKNYLDEGVFWDMGIDVEYHHFSIFNYPQRFGDFIGGLSTLDYIFNDPDLVYWSKRK